MDRNFCIIEGRMVHDPEKINGKTGKEYMRFSIANHGKENVQYIDAVAFDYVAGFVEANAKKGDRVQIIGRLNINEWDDKESGKRRKSYDMIVSGINIFAPLKRQEDKLPEWNKMFKGVE